MTRSAWRLDTAAASWRIPPREMRVGPNGTRLGVSTLALHLKSGVCPPGHLGERERTWTQSEYQTFWARLAARGLPRRQRVRGTLDRGREQANHLQRQRQELDALVHRVPLGCAEIVRSAIVQSLRTVGVELRPEVD